MPEVFIDGIRVDAPQGWTLLDAARFLGLEIPTLCYEEGLPSWGGCRLCLVEIGEGDAARLVTSCTYPCQDGLKVRTASKRVVRARKVVLELLVAQCPQSKTLQDLASKMGLNRVRFEPKWESCIYCGLCVRMCDEQMTGHALGFVHRGKDLAIDTPFSANSAECRRCGGCIYVCPACMLRCGGLEDKNVLCGRCQNSLQPTCLDVHDDFTCWMGMTGDCGTCVREEPEKKEG